MAKKKNDPSKLCLNKHNFNSKAFFERLGEATINAADTDFGSAIATIFGTVKDDSLEKRAYNLVVISLMNACRVILIENDDRKKMLDYIPKLVEKVSKLNAEISLKLLEVEVCLDLSFFSAPHKSDFIYKIKELYQLWLYEQIIYTEAQSKTFAALLPRKFLNEIAREWNSRKEYYQPIRDHFDNPFIEAILKENETQAYYAELEAYYSLPVFGSEKMTLADIYIEPNFKVYRKCLSKSQLGKLEHNSEGFYDLGYKDGSLHKYLLDLLAGNYPLGLNAEKSNIFILLGQPGQGKTSFCIRTIYDLLSKDLIGYRNLYFIRFREIIDESNIINNPLETLRKQISREKYRSDQTLPLNDLEETILILDGLDELYMQKGLTNSDIDEIVYKLSRELKQIKGLKILLTTRYNYLNLNELSGEEFLILKISEFTLNQQIDWLKKYKSIYENCKLTQITLKEISANNDKKFDTIKELINQPILLQMVAQSEISITDGVNRSKIYEELFDTVIERKWSKDKQLKKFKNLEQKDLRELLRTIALVIYQSEFEYVRKKDFEFNPILKKAINRFRTLSNSELSLEDTVKEVLVSFYFKSKSKDQNDNNFQDQRNEDAIEFLHKSLQEYLTAEKIWFFFKNNFKRKDDDRVYVIDEWHDALSLIYPIVSTKFLSIEVVTYLNEIIENDPFDEGKKEVKNRLELFFSNLLDRDFLLKYEANSENKSPFVAGLNTFYTYWTIMTSLATGKTIKEENRDKFLKLLKALRIFLPNTLINLKGADLGGADLEGAHLVRADLEGAHLVRAHLVRANLIRANLVDAVLVRANLVDAILERANLRGASLEGAHLVGANLGGAHLVSAHLRGAHLEGANLVGANLGGANLEGANLEGAHLVRAHLVRAHLGGANLVRAHLVGAHLEGAHLEGADLEGAHLERADLRDARLRDAHGLSLDQLLKVSSLKKCKGLPEDLEKELRNKKPELFD